MPRRPESTPEEITATAVRRGGKGASRYAMRLRADNGLMIQCPRDWRDELANGCRYALFAVKRSDGACMVAHPGQGLRHLD